MIVLSRKKNESIVINNDITVTVVEIRGDKVRLGIVSPKEVPVHRQEVYDAIYGRSSDPSPVVVSSLAAPTAVVAGPVVLSDRYVIDKQYVLRFDRSDENAGHVQEAISAMGLTVEPVSESRCRVVLNEDQYRRLTTRFRFRGM